MQYRPLWAAIRARCRSRNPSQECDMTMRRPRSFLVMAEAASLLALSPHAGARTDLRKPLQETHVCTAVGRWCLQSNAWINLHQRLIAEACHGAASPQSLAGDDRVRWQQAVDRYRTYLGERSLLFDAELVELAATLS